MLASATRSRHASFRRASRSPSMKRLLGEARRISRVRRAPFSGDVVEVCRRYRRRPVAARPARRSSPVMPHFRQSDGVIVGVRRRASVSSTPRRRRRRPSGSSRSIMAQRPRCLADAERATISCCYAPVCDTKFHRRHRRLPKPVAGRRECINQIGSGPDNGRGEILRSAPASPRRIRRRLS